MVIPDRQGREYNIQKQMNIGVGRETGTIFFPAPQNCFLERYSVAVLECYWRQPLMCLPKLCLLFITLPVVAGIH